MLLLRSYFENFSFGFLENIFQYILEAFYYLFFEKNIKIKKIEFFSETVGLLDRLTQMKSF